MEIYHVCTNRKAELEVVKKVKPPRLMLSYFHWKKVSLSELIRFLEYTPKIMLDSGAFTAYNTGKGIALEDYMKYVSDNLGALSHYISLDVIYDNLVSYRYWQIMKEKGYNPIPVFHYLEDENYLQRYIDSGCTYIALGGTVPIHDKEEVANWIRMLTWKYPEIQFHVLGSSSKKIFLTCDIASMDSSTWWMMAVNGKPNTIKGKGREKNILRAIENMKKELQYVDGLVLD